VGGCPWTGGGSWRSRERTGPSATYKHFPFSRFHHFATKLSILYSSISPLLLHYVSRLVRSAACAIATPSSPRPATCLDSAYDALTTTTSSPTTP
jgi:hypothetical protein